MLPLLPLQPVPGSEHAALPERLTPQKLWPDTRRRVVNDFQIGKPGLDAERFVGQQFKCLSGSVEMSRDLRKRMASFRTDRIGSGLHFDQYILAIGQVKLEIRCVAPEPCTIRVVDANRLLCVANNQRRGLKMVKRIEFEQPFVMHHAAGFSAGELAPDDAPCGTKHLSSTLVRKAVRGKSPPRPSPGYVRHSNSLQYRQRGVLVAYY